MAKSWDNINESLREIIRMLQDLIAKEDSRVINLVSSESVHDRDISIAGETNGADAKTTSFIPIVTNVKDHVCNGFSSEALPNPVKRMPNVIKSLTSRLDSGEAFLIRHEAATAHVQELIPEKDNQRGQMIQVYEVKGMQKKLRSLGPRSDPGGIVHIRGRPAIDSDQELKEFGKVNDVATDETVVGQANKITITNGKWMFSKKQIEKIVRDASRSKVENEEHKKKVKMKFQLGSIPWQQYLLPNLGFDFHGDALSSSSSVWGFDGHGVQVLEDCLNRDDRETAQKKVKMKMLKNFVRKEEMVYAYKLFDEMLEKNKIQYLVSLWVFQCPSSQVAEKGKDGRQVQIFASWFNDSVIENWRKGSKSRLLDNSFNYELEYEKESLWCCISDATGVMFFGSGGDENQRNRKWVGQGITFPIGDFVPANFNMALENVNVVKKIVEIFGKDETSFRGL